jgi:negative regulator of sigma E activity
VLRIVAVRDRDESRYVYRVFEQMEAELAAQAAITIAEKPAMDVAPAIASVEYAVAI